MFAKLENPPLRLKFWKKEEDNYGALGVSFAQPQSIEATQLVRIVFHIVKKSPDKFHLRVEITHCKYSALTQLKAEFEKYSGYAFSRCFFNRPETYTEESGSPIQGIAFVSKNFNLDNESKLKILAAITKAYEHCVFDKSNTINTHLKSLLNRLGITTPMPEVVDTTNCATAIGQLG